MSTTIICIHVHVNNFHHTESLQVYLISRQPAGSIIVSHYIHETVNKNGVHAYNVHKLTRKIVVGTPQSDLFHASILSSESEQTSIVKIPLSLGHPDKLLPRSITHDEINY